MRILVSTAMIIVGELLFGCSAPSFGIRVIDTEPKEIYVTFADGVTVNPGDVFLLYHLRPPRANVGGHGSHGGAALSLKQEIGKVQVVALVDETHAVVKILSGRVENDAEVEKLDEQPSSGSAAQQ